MLFLLLRILPVIGPVIYFFILRGLVGQSRYWLWWLLGAVIINIIHFSLLWLRRRRNRVWLFFLYTEIFAVVGFGYVLLLSNRTAVLIFSLVWSFIYLVLLESIFNYLYRTEKILFIELKNVTNYISLILAFLASFCLVYLYVFISFSWWLAIFIYFAIIFIVLSNHFLFYSYNYKANGLYAIIITVVLVEILGVLMWWPTSVYVVATVIAVLFYLLSALASLDLAEKFTRKLVLKYSLFSLLVLAVVLFTAQWI